MAYLDDRKRVNMWIVAMTIPAIAFFLQRTILASAPDNTGAVVDLLNVLGTVAGAVWLSPLFLLIQISMIVRGTAGASWQNFTCIVITAAGALMAWGPRLGLG